MNKVISGSDLMQKESKTDDIESNDGKVCVPT